MYHDLDINSVFEALKTSEAGLSSEEAEKRLLEYGRNELKEEGKISPLKLFLSQFKSLLILILIAAALVSAGLGELVDSIVIMFTVFLAGILGFVQEYRAEKAIELLKSLSSPEALVIRAGIEKEIPSGELVPGDLLLLEAGDRIPADGRLIEAINLRADESALTGESMPVEKNTGILPQETEAADRLNLVYSGTVVSYGRGRAVVTATGMQSSFGTLAGLLGKIEREKTPLQASLDQFGRIIGAATLVVVGFVVGLGILRGFTFFDMFLWGVALAVAAIPEALPAVVTVGLGLGVRRMVKRNALVRRLPSVETLGATNVICSDKTGTLTQNKMTVEQIYVDGELLEVKGEGYIPEGIFLKNPEQQPISPNEPSLRQLLITGALCNDAKLIPEKEGNWNIRGDPTEAALVVAAAKGGFQKRELEASFQRVGEIPFSSERKRMTTLNLLPEGIVAHSKGAPEEILASCTKILLNGSPKPLTAALKEEILASVRAMAGQTLRVMAFSYRPLESEKNEGIASLKTSDARADIGDLEAKKAEEDMIFLGLMGMRDPPRKEVLKAIQTCKEAGIRPVMITGDHKTTALAVAEELKIFKEGDLVLTGKELEDMKASEFEAVVERVSVYARVYPTSKLRVVEALKKKGYIVAMTGDGVNDAPALKAADMGIAMGITGTDVSKEASSMILTDDNFASIVAAVEEGRNIFKNIRNFIVYGLTCHIGEVLIVLAAVLYWQLLPLIAVQILWINLITDGLPPMALSVEPPDRGLMRQKPRNVKEGLITRREISAGLAIGGLIAVQALLVLVWALENGFSQAKLQTLIFTLVVLSEMFNAFNWRSDRYSIFALGLFSNKPLLYAVGTTLLLQLLVIYVPLLQTAFRTVPLSLSDWGVILPLAFSTFIAVELVKFIEIRRYK
ncbi:MAG: cation-translocating P-type ATPase [Methanosarcinaceae archaeon]|nr:cation-translocating P-type ATPase [Methanosarcinaceae archaeon]